MTESAAGGQPGADARSGVDARSGADAQSGAGTTSGADRELTDFVDLLIDLLGDGARGRLVERSLDAPDAEQRLRRLRSAFNAHRVDGRKGRLTQLVRALDERTRGEGFRVLHSWDHTSHTFTDDVVPALLVDYYRGAGGAVPEAGAEVDEAVVFAVLVDYYFLNLLSLAAIRAVAAGDPDAQLARVDRALELLHGEGGSGHRFVRDAETLVIYAVSQFHPEEQAYDRLIARVARLEEARRFTFACASAAVLSAHLRWGFWVMYERDVLRMRADNVGDYPWLLATVHTLLRAWTEAEAGSERRDAAGGALLVALAADPWITRPKCPEVLADFGDLHAECWAMIEAGGASLLADLDRLAPKRGHYSPLGLLFNFPHNALIAQVTLALLESKPRAVSINALFEHTDDRERSAELERLAGDLMAFSRATPDRLGYKGSMLIAYDPLTALRGHAMTMETLRAELPA